MLESSLLHFSQRTSSLQRLAKRETFGCGTAPHLNLRHKFSDFQPPSNATLGQHGLSAGSFSPEGSKVCLTDCAAHACFGTLGTGKLVAQEDLAGIVEAITVDESNLVAAAGFDYSANYEMVGICETPGIRRPDMSTKLNRARQAVARESSFNRMED